MVKTVLEHESLFSFEELVQAANRIQSEGDSREMAKSSMSSVDQVDLESLLSEKTQDQSVELSVIPEPVRYTEEELIGIVTQGIDSLSPTLQEKTVSELFQNLSRGAQCRIVSEVAPQLGRRSARQSQKDSPEENGVITQLAPEMKRESILLEESLRQLRARPASKPEIPKTGWVECHGLLSGTFRSYHHTFCVEATKESLRDGDIKEVKLDPKTMKVVVRPRHGPSTEFDFGSEEGKAWLDLKQSLTNP